ncbi:MAG: hypothetical protein ACI9BS_000424, partial [Candidatus Poriferisodalaceae bacterium]
SRRPKPKRLNARKWQTFISTNNGTVTVPKELTNSSAS